MIFAIDISDQQSGTPPLHGISLVVIKATEGHTYVNPRQKEQAANSRSGGAAVGFYHFLWPGNIPAQAAWFVAQAVSVPGDTLWCDWETTEAGTRATCAEKDAFLAEVQRLRPDHKVGLYCNLDFWLNHDTSSKTGNGGLWIADPDSAAGHPRVVHSWVLHQYAETSGIDRDIVNFATLDAFQTWARGTTSPTPPAAPVVHLSKVVHAASVDPKGKQGAAADKTEVLHIENALVAEGLLAKKWVDGSFGSETVKAYARLQTNEGFKGKDANGIPGKITLTKLGQRHGFTVSA